MSYSIKKIRYQNKDRHILLQNENGPCPLLAAANAVLLDGSCRLPPSAVQNRTATLQDVTNMLAEQALIMSSSSPSKGGKQMGPGAVDNEDDEYDLSARIHIDELVQYMPKFQYGMDVNLKFTQGITGYEYTAQLTAFDMLRCKLVHGWLVDPQDEETFLLVHGKTYNELIERVVQGKETFAEIQKLEQEIQQQQQLQTPVLDGSNTSVPDWQQQLVKLRKQAQDAMLIEEFLQSTGNQLTQHGLLQLHEEVRDNEICIFFRANHFGTLTKHDGYLYLLVTDCGYAHSPSIVWERLDVIDGDTEYVNSEFRQAGMGDGTMGLVGTASAQPLEEQMIAAATEASLREYHGLTNGQGPSDVLEVGVPVQLADETTDTPTAVPPLSTSDGPTLTSNTQATTTTSQEEADRMLALQLQNDAGVDFDDESYQLARRLQDEENQRRHANATSTGTSRTNTNGTTISTATTVAASNTNRTNIRRLRPPRTSPASTTTASASPSSSSSGCIIS